MDRSASSGRARQSGEGDDSEKNSVLQHWATSISVAHTDSTGQRSSAHEAGLQVDIEVSHGRATLIEGHDGGLDLLQDGGAGRQDSGGGLAPSSENGGSTGHGSLSGKDHGLDPIVVTERRLGAELEVKKQGGLEPGPK